MAVENIEWDAYPDTIRCKKVNGRWLVFYFRLWDSSRNWEFPNHKENVLAAIAHCKKLNQAEILSTSTESST